MKTLQAVFLVTLIILAWSCTPSESVVDGSNNATNSSYSTVLVVGNYLYGVSDNSISTVDITDKENVKVIDIQELGFNIESIFHYDGLLLVGSSTTMYILEIDEEGLPQLKSSTLYFREVFTGCDPIIARDTFAYVTLSNSNGQLVNTCRGGTQTLAIEPQLQVYSISDIENPRLLTSYPMHNPKGLAFINEDLIAIAEDDKGIKVLDVSDLENVKKVFEKSDFDATDIIVDEDIMIVVGQRDLTQFDVSEAPQIGYLSRIVLR